MFLILPPPQLVVAPRSAAAGSAIGMLLDWPIAVFYHWVLHVVSDSPPDWLTMSACACALFLVLGTIHAWRVWQLSSTVHGFKPKQA
eukprot:365043-Chlamydomonas_euryale.AAC.15